MKRFYSNRSITAVVLSDTTLQVWCRGCQMAESNPNRDVLAQMDAIVTNLRTYADKMQDRGTVVSTQVANDALDAALELPNALREALREAGYDSNPYEDRRQGWHVLEYLR